MDLCINQAHFHQVSMKVYKQSYCMNLIMAIMFSKPEI